MIFPFPFTLAYSPCPNDTFIFAAWGHGLLPNAPPVKVVLDDVEALNRAARNGVHALTKVSYGAIPWVLDQYRILRSGGALGRGCGPLLVAKPESGLRTLRDCSSETVIAIPGRMTTAFLLCQLALGHTPTVVEMRFDRIVDAVAAGEVDAGLIIHESRFTYTSAGLVCVADLGAWWEESTGKPIPLGAILVRRDMGDEQALLVDETIRASLRYAYTNRERIEPYLREHASEMDADVLRAHIDLYVNEYSFEMGMEGESAVATLFSRAAEADLIPATKPDFVPYTLEF
jgi:1,4-dihydroxy-6-naphthoate synthase